MEFFANWGFWISLGVVYLLIFIAFTVLMALSAKVERERKARERCMMNHPAGSLAKTEPSPFGQTNHDSTLTDAEIRAKYRGGLTFLAENSPKQHSLEVFSSRPHHLEGD